MADPTAVEGSEDVSDFLRRIRELSEQRDQEDAERTRKLEAEIMEGRKQREARRLERARSLSPEKTPTGTPSSLRSSRSKPLPENSMSSPLASTPSLPPPASLSAIVSEDKIEKPSKSLVEASSSPSSSPSLARSFTHEPESTSASKQPPLGRTGGLSWQQRPGSQISPRPTVQPHVSERPLPSKPTEPELEHRDEEVEMSRAQIADSLASKDPSWFRQTADRGKGSPAYRKNEADDNSNLGKYSGRQRLHGLGNTESKENVPLAPSYRRSASPLDETAHGSVTQTRPSRTDVGLRSPELSVLSTRPSVVLPVSHASDDVAEEGELGKRPSSFSRERPERSQSPTKGMGGFVQSAMLRRNESVSKRWTAQGATGLQRQNSNSGFESRHQGLPPSSSMPKLVDTSDASALPQDVARFSTRPQSMYSTFSRGESDLAPQALEADDSLPRDNLAGKHERSRSRSDLRSTNDATSRRRDVTSPPASPSKRWSPTKASWLESALNKPEVSKPKPTPPSQPMWLSELNKSRQHQSAVTSKADKEETQPESVDQQKEHRPSMSQSKTPAPVTRPKPSRLSDGATNAVTPDRAEEASTTSIKDEKLGSPMDEDKRAPLSKESPDHLEDRPKTPTKVDLRSTLRSPTRAAKPEAKGEPEFLSAFGKLKKTKTENYVAPDVFKGNILRGKAALNVTGGPQKTPRKDELKESLVQQREAMKAKAATTDASSHPPQPSNSSERSTTPEAIAKRRALGRNDDSGNLQGSPQQKPAIKSRQNGEDIPAPVTAQAETRKPEILQSAQQLDPKTGLAGRFNPALANLLAKGRPTMGAGSQASTEPTSSASAIPSTRPTDNVSSSSSSQLQHMTKSRARGPKRRAPKATSESTEGSAPSSASNPSAFGLTSRSAAPMPRTPSSSITNKAQPAPQIRSVSNNDPKPQTPPKSARITNMQAHEPQPAAEEKKEPLTNDESRQPAPETKPNRFAKGTPVASAVNPLKADSEIPKSPISSKDVLASSKPRGVPEDGANGKPLTLPKKNAIELPLRGIGPGKEQRPASPFTESRKPDSTDQVTSSPRPNDSSKPKPTPRKPSGSVSPAVAAMGAGEILTPKNGNESRTGSNSQAEEVLIDNFGHVPKVMRESVLDAQSVLSIANGSEVKSKTVQKRITEITGDGKLIPLPAQHQHILYSNTMYLCTHVFETEKTARTTEVYLWIGSGISESTVEDVQIFAKKAARESSGTLRTIRQGKEPSELFQALGGIVLVRRGSSKDASDSYMLCGRQHLGHVAFDEVDLALSSLCAGFTYVVASKSPDKVFLWKGVGSSPEEVGCARLISMDLGPTGEVTEVDEGREPQSFLAVLQASGGESIPRSADHWKLKPAHQKYQARLFLIDTDSNGSRPGSAAGSMSQVSNLWQSIRRPSAPDSAKPSLREIRPFTQNDLEPDKVYVLDAFFEIYVIVGPVAGKKSLAFATAVVFAQDYAILAASKDDRPFVPVGTVVMQGAPRDMKAVFRQWDDGAMNTGALMAGSKSKGLKILPLSATATAVRGE